MGLFSGSKKAGSFSSAKEGLSIGHIANPAANNGYTKQLYSDDASPLLSPHKFFIPKDSNGKGGSPVDNRLAEINSKAYEPDPATAQAAFQPLTAPTNTYQAGPAYAKQDYFNPNAANESSALTRRFDVLRGKAEGEASTNTQAANDQLMRSAASKGRLGSGNVVKQGMVEQNQLEGQKQNAINDIESQRNLAQADLGQKESDRQFAFNQEEAGRAFQSGEAEKQRGFASNQANQQMQNELNVSNRDAAFRQEQFGASNDQFRQQMDQAVRQMQMDSDVTDFNKKMASKGKATPWYQNFFNGKAWGKI